MGENEISATVELSVGGGVIPLQGKLATTMTHRFSKRGVEVLEPSSKAIGDARLIDRLAGNEELDVLVVRAMHAAATSASHDKRRLLGRVVKAAVLDDAKVDESVLIVGVLEQIDTPHIRCLEAVYRAEQEAIASGDMAPTARGAQRELTPQVRDVVATYPVALVQQLQSLGLLDGSLTWDGVITVSGTTVFGTQVLDDLRSSGD